MPTSYDKLEERFGERFGGMKLAAVRDIFWPVFRHTFSYEVRETAPLSPIEEGLLRIVTAGVENVADAAHFLGVREPLVDTISSRLSASVGPGTISPLFFQNEVLKPTEQTEIAIKTCRRPILEGREIFLFRDGLFGEWLDFDVDDKDRFPIHLRADPDGETARWLGARQTHICDEEHTRVEREHELIQKLAGASELMNPSLCAAGNLEWVALSLACYQSEDHRGGRLLLFNPAEQDRPLELLSDHLQSYLEANDSPPFYFPDDPLGTAKEFWRTFAGAIRVETWRAQGKGHQDKVEKELDGCRQSQAPQDGQITERSSAELQESERGTKEFADRIERAPKVEYLYQAEQHRDVLRRVLREARDTVIIISPWIRSQALEPLIPEIRKALERQVEVWIGYGMPPSPKHKDNTDPHAVNSLLELTSEGHLYVVKSKYGTHEKVLIRDHDLSVVGSWNWLSYGGGDGRGEMSTLVEGQDRVRELQVRTLLRLQKELQEASE